MCHCYRQAKDRRLLDKGLEEEQGGQRYSKTFSDPLALAAEQLPSIGGSHLFEKTCANGAGELGESVYGLKADFR